MPRSSETCSDSLKAAIRIRPDRSGHASSPRSNSAGAAATPSGRPQPEMRPRRRRGDPPARGTRQQTRTNEKRLSDRLDRLGLLGNGDRERGEPDRTPAEAPHKRVEHRVVEPVEAELVDLVDLQRGPGDRPGDLAVGANLGVVADPAEQSVGDPRGAAGPATDLLGRVRGRDRRRAASRCGRAPARARRWSRSPAGRRTRTGRAAGPAACRPGWSHRRG